MPAIGAELLLIVFIGRTALDSITTVPLQSDLVRSFDPIEIGQHMGEWTRQRKERCVLSMQSAPRNTEAKAYGRIAILLLYPLPLNDLLIREGGGVF